MLLLQQPNNFLRQSLSFLLNEKVNSFTPQATSATALHFDFFFFNNKINLFYTTSYECKNTTRQKLYYL